MSHLRSAAPAALVLAGALTGCGEAPFPAPDQAADGADAAPEIRVQQRTAAVPATGDAPAREPIGAASEVAPVRGMAPASFSSWDADGDARMSRAELSGGLYRAWDQSRDLVLSRAEWLDGRERWLPGPPVRERWKSWDADGDAHLDAAEFAAGLERAALYAWLDDDSDGGLDRSEVEPWLGSPPGALGE